MAPVLPRGLKRQTLINENRFQILMKDIRNDVVRTTQNSKSLDIWVSKLGGVVVQNALTTGKYAGESQSILSNIVKSTKYSSLPKGGHQELVKGVMSENTMHYVTKMGDDMKTQLRQIAVESYDKKLAPRDIAKQMSKQIDGMSNTRAKMIARTETMRASNLANYTNAMMNRGAQSFIVAGRDDRCPLCSETYDDVTFTIDQNDMIPPLHPNCYDKQTEIYTNHGWKLFKDVNDNDLILSMNPKTHGIEFIPFVKKIEYHHKGEMYHIHNKWFDMKVTPDHDVYTEKRVDHGKQGRYLEPRFVKPSELHSEHRILRTCDYNKQSPEYIDINGLKFKPEDYAFFMAWYLSEGSVLHNDPSIASRGYPIKIAQHIPENRIILEQRLIEIGNSLGLKLSIQKQGFEFYSKEIYEHLKPLGYSHEKHIPSELFQLSKEHLNIFLDNYVLGDGHERIRSNKMVNDSSERILFTSSKRLADDLSFVILLAGFYPSFKVDNTKGKEVEFKNGTYTINHDTIRISINKSKHTNISGCTIDIIPYDDMVYCLELPIWHTLWIKSNNKTSWGGNCRCFPQFSRDMAPDATEEVSVASMANAVSILDYNGLTFNTHPTMNHVSNIWDQVIHECVTMGECD